MRKKKLGFFSFFCIVHAVFKKKPIAYRIFFIFNFDPFHFKLLCFSTKLYFIYISVFKLKKNERESIETKRPYLDFLGISLAIEI